MLLGPVEVKLARIESALGQAEQGAVAEGVGLEQRPARRLVGPDAGVKPFRGLQTLIGGKRNLRSYFFREGILVLSTERAESPASPKRPRARRETSRNSRP